MTTTTHQAAQALAERHAGIITSLSRYLARVGFPSDVVGAAVSEAVVQLDQRPDLANPMAWATTVARNEAERLHAEPRKPDAAATSVVGAPDLMKVLSGKRPASRRRRPQRESRAHNTSPTG
jgi:DNA-directed RNA polymerase specialized sigma24 family protein